MKHRVSNSAEFEEACRAIEDGWRTRWSTRSGEARPRDGGAVRWLERQAYELIGSMLEDGLKELWEPRRQRLSKRGGGGRTAKPFAVGLRVIFADCPNRPDARKRELISLRLAYAHKHFVPFAFITAFLASIPRRPHPNDIQPHFEEWVAFMIRRVEVSIDHEERGRYPQEIIALSQDSRVNAVMRLTNNDNEELNDWDF